MLKKALPLFTLVFLLIGWEIASHLSPHLLFVLPPPSNILSTFVECRSRLFFHTWVTMKEMGGGVLLAITASFPLAWMMMRFKTTRAILQPAFIAIQCLPMFALAPIMVIWFGWGYTAIVAPTALMIFFPLTLNIYQGLRSTPQDLLEFFQTNQATPLQTFFKLRLPFAVPHIFAGFRITAAIAGIGAVAGEWAGAQNGLGILMLESRRNTDIEITFCALLCLTLVSGLLYILVLLAEKQALPPRSLLFSFGWKKKPLQKPRFAFAAFLLGTLFFSFVSCQKEPHVQTTRLLLDWLPNPNHVPLYVGIDRGYFKEEGITLTVQKMHESGGGISYLTSGQADLLINHLPGTLRACARGADLVIAGILIEEPLAGLIYKEDPAIQNPADLSGKVLGYCLGGPDTTFLDFLLDQGEIAPKEKRNVSVDIILALGTGSVDFIYGGFWNIEPAQFRSLGVETGYFKLDAFDVPPYYEMIILANASSPQANPLFLDRFRRALQKSIAFSKVHPEEAFAIYLRHNPDKREKTLSWERDAWEETHPLLTDSQTVNPQLLETFYAWLVARQLVTHSFDYQNLIR